MDRKRAIKQYKEIKRLKGEMRLAAQGWPEKWHTLISTILSARTLDETTIKVSDVLYKRYKKIKDLANAELNEIEKMIKPVNFYKNKSKNIKACAKILYEEYKGLVPENFSELIKLPGVGPKTANVFLSEIGKDAIGVDTHVEYISKKLDWTKNKKPVDIENDLKKLFPQKLWREINTTLVKFGKKYTSRKEKDKILNIISSK